MKKDKSGFIDLGPIKERIPVNGGIMPVNYGYAKGTLNESEGDEVDVLIISEADMKVGDEIAARPIALIERADGDDKIVAADETKPDLIEWADIPSETRELIEEFFSYQHPFLSIKDAVAAEAYLEASMKKCDNRQLEYGDN